MCRCGDMLVPPELITCKRSINDVWLKEGVWQRLRILVR